jgi:hypothetical protein
MTLAKAYDYLKSRPGEKKKLANLVPPLQPLESRLRPSP